MSELGLNTPLGEARRWLAARVDQGDVCPCCTQFAKVYRRKLNSGMARALIAMYRARGTAWMNIHEIDVRGGDYGKLAHWNLIEEEHAVRDDGSGRTGWWRVTDRGCQFVLGEIAVPKYVRIYNGRLLSTDLSERVLIRDALGDRFDYQELMSA